jgi:hypothetical protein
LCCYGICLEAGEKKNIKMARHEAHDSYAKIRTLKFLNACRSASHSTTTFDIISEFHAFNNTEQIKEILLTLHK